MKSETCYTNISHAAWRVLAQRHPLARYWTTGSIGRGRGRLTVMHLHAPQTSKDWQWVLFRIYMNLTFNSVCSCIFLPAGGLHLKCWAFKEWFFVFFHLTVPTLPWPFVFLSQQRPLTTYQWWQRTLRPYSVDTRPRISLWSALRKEENRLRRWVLLLDTPHCSTTRDLPL